MSNKSLFITLMILVIIFGVAVLYTSDKEFLTRFGLNKDIEVVPTKEVVDLPTARPSKITKEEMLALTKGPTTGSQADLEKYSENVNNVSVLSQILDISSCNPTPNVLSFSLSKPLILVNNDVVSHNISITVKGKGEVLSVVPPKYQKELWIVTLGQGIYSYVCDGQGPAGIFLVQ